jgi:hypothetical protein
VIEVLFSSSTAWQSHLIRCFSHSPFSHVDVVMPDGNLLGASNSPDAPVIEGNPSGVAIRPFDYQDFYIRRLAKLEVPRDAKLPAAEVESNFYQLLRSQLGKPFDSAALHAMFGDAMLLERDWTAADAWFCSEDFIWALHNAGFFPYELIVPKSRVSPADSLLIIGPYIVNPDELWQPIPGLTLGPREHMVFHKDGME